MSAMSRAVSSAKSVLVLLAVCVVAAAAHTAVATYSADCVAYAPYFPYAQTSTACIMENMCYKRTFCCAAAAETDHSLCLDITAFTCDLAAACANHSGDAGWYPFTLDGGLSVTCCKDGYTTTPAPAVPNFDPSGSVGSGDSANTEPLPARTCDENAEIGCVVSNGFPSLVRAFCQNAIPPSYTDAYLMQSASNMCCQYAAAPSGTTAHNATVGTVVCGMALLDLPHVGEYHCSLSGRAKTICCNGVITSSHSTSSMSDASTSLGDTYAYLNDTCLFLQHHDDAALHGYDVATLVALVAVVVATVISAIL